MGRLRLDTCLVGLLFLLCPLRGDAAIGGLTDDEVQVDLLTQATGGFADPTAVVGAGVEFSRQFVGGEVTLSVDMLDSGFVLSYVSTGGGINPSGFNVGLLGFELSSLDFASGEVIVGVQEQGSTWPADTFDTVSFGPHSISIDLTGKGISLHNLDSFVATFAITTPEPAGGAELAAAGLALGVLRRARYSRSGGVTRAIQPA